MIKVNFRIWNIFLVAFTSIFLFSCDKKSETEAKNNKKTELADAELAAKENLLQLLQTEMFLSEAAKLGSEKATEVEIKEFSEKANKNHTAVLEKIKLICEEKGYEIPDKLSKELNDKLYKLTVANTSDFDRYYLQTLDEEYLSNIDSLAKDINNNKYPNDNVVLLEIASNYNMHLDKLEKINK